ncbi:MAG: bifunctional adenosylcobinamide kinase/adenosylcobinamide-phosphate guanylyltransferase [Pseudomonadota bacterium]
MDDPQFPCHLVLGGTRSGKSRYAEAVCRETELTRIYIATAAAHDSEMQERIAGHKEMRANDGWQTVEEQHDLASALVREMAPEQIVLVDCLTLWLTNRLLSDAEMPMEFDRLEATLKQRRGPVVLVSNETGLGIVPENALARRFSDLQGLLNQRMATLSTHVTLVAAGIPLTLKEPSA